MLLFVLVLVLPPVVIMLCWWVVLKVFVGYLKSVMSTRTVSALKTNHQKAGKGGGGDQGCKSGWGVVFCQKIRLLFSC